MKSTHNPISVQLQMACKQTGSRWAIWLKYKERDWSPGVSYGLSASLQDVLYAFLHNDDRASWLAGAQVGRRTRWQDCGSYTTKLKCNRVYVFPNLEAQQILAVGSDGLDTYSESLMRLLAFNPPIPDVPQEQNEILVELVRQLKAFRDTALDITADLDLEAVLKSIVLRARDLVNARGAELGLLDLDNPSDGQPGVRVMISEVPWTDMRGQKIPILAGIAGTMAVTAQAVAVPDYNAWENRLMPERIAPFQAAAGVPLKLAGRMIGTLVVMDDKPERVFTPGDITILEMMAPQAAIAIRNAQLFQELEERIQAQQSTESRLVRAARMAAVGEMAGSVAHELNNPLTSVIMFIELTLKQLAVESKMHQNMSQALNEALRCRSVIQRLLNVSRDTRPISETHDQIGIDR